MPARVAELAVAPVKGLAVVHRERLEIGPEGVPEDRRFFVVDETDRVLTARDAAALLPVRPDYDHAGQHLRLTLPGGDTVDGPVRTDGRVATNLFDKDREGRIVEGPFAEALSEVLGRRVRLVQAERDGVGWDDAPVSLASQASVEEVARQGGDAPSDARRFRMTILLDGLDPHGEDAWVGRIVRIGDARLRVVDRLVRCAVITTSPDTGRRDWNGLGALAAYRGKDNVCLGVGAEVERPGTIAVGDEAQPE